MTPIYGAVEAGGTKFVCIVASGPGDIRAETRFPTTTPQETIQRTIEFFQEYQNTSGERITAVGVGSFGPIDLHTDSKTFGFITSTPKPGWANADLVGPIKNALQVPVFFDTDVNAAALGEGLWGAARGLTDFIYITIGTGIGGGVVSGGRLIHGLVHTEVGHILLPHDRARDPYPGRCPYHKDCFEGMASGPALKERWGESAETFPTDHPAWDLEAHYVAQALHSLICVYSPQRIILGGGVMQQEHLLKKVRTELLNSLNGYVQSPTLLEHIETYVVNPGLGNYAGSLGSLALAQTAA